MGLDLGQGRRGRLAQCPVERVAGRGAGAGDSRRGVRPGRDLQPPQLQVGRPQSRRDHHVSQPRRHPPDARPRRAAARDRIADHVYWHSAALFISDNVATQIDGLGHITAGLDDHWYNGFKEADWGGDWGPRKCDASTIPPIVARGVLIDVAAFKKVDALPGHTLISTKDLQDTLAWEGVTLAPGDVVLVRTGTARYWGEDGADHARIAEHDSAGPDLTATRWLVEEQGAIMVGSDTSGYEVNPAARLARDRHPRPSLLARRAGRPPRRVPQPRGAQPGQGLHVLLRRRHQQDQGDRRRLRSSAPRDPLGLIAGCARELSRTTRTGPVLRQLVRSRKCRLR